MMYYNVFTGFKIVKQVIQYVLTFSPKPLRPSDPALFLYFDEEFFKVQNKF